MAKTSYIFIENVFRTMEFMGFFCWDVFLIRIIVYSEEFIKTVSSLQF